MKNKLKSLKNVHGVTLISLVVTIIILLILAGVTILTLTGNNGILKKSNTAKEETNEKTATEIMNLKITNAQIKSYSEEQQMPNLQYLANRLCEDNDMEYVELTSQKKNTASINETFLPLITVPEKGSIFTKLKEYPYEFEIDDNLRLASVNGIQVAEKNSSYDELKTEVQTMKEKINTLESLINTQAGQINTLNSTLANQANNRVSLMNSPIITVPLSGYIEKDFGTISLSNSIENYSYLEFQFDFSRDRQLCI